MYICIYIISVIIIIIIIDIIACDPNRVCSGSGNPALRPVGCDRRTARQQTKYYITYHL